jgi:hypothetical protein
MANNHAGDKSDNGLIIGVVLLLVGPLLAWYLLRKPVVFFWSWINYGQIWLLAHVQGLVGQHPVAEHMAANQPLLNWLLWAHIHDGKITWHQVVAISTEVGSYYRWVFVPIILLLAGNQLYGGGKTSKPLRGGRYDCGDEGPVPLGPAVALAEE